jgi:hypothetical protein
LLAALRSTLTVLASQMGGTYRFALRSIGFVLINLYTSSRGRNASKRSRDFRFHSFEFFLRHWPAFPFFNEMIEQDLSPAAFAPISERFPCQLPLQL